MTPLEATIRAYMEESAEELNMIVRPDGVWDAGTWDMLYGALHNHGPDMRSAHAQAAVYYCQCAKILVEYLYEEPYPECTVVLYWELRFDMRHLQRTIDVANDYRRGIRRPSFRSSNSRLKALFHGKPFSEIEMALLSESIRVCSAVLEQLGDECPNITLQEAQHMLDIELKITALMEPCHNGRRWYKSAFVTLWHALEEEADGMRDAAPFALKYYAEILMLISEYLRQYRRRADLDDFYELVRVDLEMLQTTLADKPPFSRYEKDIVEQAQSDCWMSLQEIQSRLRTT